MNEQLLELMSRFKTIIHDDLSLEMKQYAEEFDVPIIQDQGLELMLQLLRIKQPKAILEIGTAIGYSSLMMARHLPHAQIVSIERDTKRYQEAVAYHERSSIQDQVTLIEADALEIANEELPIQKYDVIFIDAAKAQYQKFFEKYVPFVKKNGIIIVDNLDFHGMIFDIDHIKNRNTRQLVKKIKRFKDWIFQHDAYDVEYYAVGDGICVIRRKDEQ